MCGARYVKRAGSTENCCALIETWKGTLAVRGGASADGSSGAPKKKKSVDDEAVAAFVRAVPEASKNTRDALAAAKKALDEMHQEQKLLREYVGDKAMQIPEILESIASFSSKLVASRTALMKELGSSSRRSSVQTTSSA